MKVKGTGTQMGETSSDAVGRSGWTGMFAAGGVLGALGASSCCVLPVALFAVGASGPWIGGLTALSPYQPYFLAASAVLIVLGLWELRRRARLECAGGACARPRRRLLAKGALGLAVALIMLNLVWPRLLPVLLG